MKSRGFTLIETLAVLVIISVSVSLVTIGFQRLENDKLETSAGRLTGWLQNISDSAVLDGAVYGVSLDSQSSQLVTYYNLNNRWWLIADDDFRSPRIPGEFDLVTDGASSWRAFDTDENPQPKMIFLPIGSVEPERLVLSDTSDERQAQIERDEGGFFSWHFL
ncbi:MAG: prepilin-type N-terminal cleavage/methylation domain-containing protein [bacterium]